ncbi:T9SS type A sorting domain-containing protein [Arenibacter sp. BSSL-BM3]|uniref:T9SS type A sorting domain-containing protein n=1 Tax=Arenibacter arenosicollis TaxID=2762274 RepID=A0ABR7QIJ4_9FLAO|nr:Ig-like domain-containing protein [Arenibacter arenosicollis]MBC8766894.1 T9SS type A sorting domain-containing protein [Arenibacter arenosicollis]
MKTKITLLLLVNIIFFQQVYSQCTGVDFEERNGIAILEMEAKLAGSWRKESVPDASANSALVYRGNDSFGAPGSSVITYSVRINSPGTYRFIWRNKIGVIASSNPSTEHNDSWLKINASDFYGLKGSHRVYPGGSGKSPVANGATSGGYFKIFTNVINWSWSTQTSDHDDHFIYATFNQAGVYSIQVSGRSSGHSIDRMVLYKEGSYSASSAQNLSTAQTNCSGGSTPPTTPPPPTPPIPPANNIPPTVSFSNITNGQNFSVGSSLSVGLSANDSDGNISKYQIFVNNTLVDTDGASYSPYLLNQLTAGSYALKATVTDNSGASTSATVNFTVGGSSPTPPTPPTPPTTPPSGNNPPSVIFTNITNGQNFAVGSSLSIGLSASDPGGSIVQHQIFVNNSLVDTDGTFYTPHLLNQMSAGNYGIKATVTDNSGTSTSATVNITVGGTSPTPPSPTPPTGGNKAPTVSFTTLIDGQQVNPGSTVSVGVSASDSDGSVIKYQILVDGIVVDTDGASFTPHPIVGITAGNHEIKVIVTDNLGATASKTINIIAGSGQPTSPTVPTISFDLINASSNANLGPISNGASLTSIAAQGVNIRANAPTNTKSVVFILTGALSRSWVESFAPYALFGDENGNYVPANLFNGSYTLNAVAYSGSSGSGSVIATKTISFNVGSTLAAKTIAYPNPVKSDGKISLKLPEGTSGDYNYSVTNAVGIQLEQGKFIAKPSQTDVDLQLSNIGRQMKGVYYLTLTSSNSKQTIPIIRE